MSLIAELFQFVQMEQNTRLSVGSKMLEDPILSSHTSLKV